MTVSVVRWLFSLGAFPHYSSLAGWIDLERHRKFWGTAGTNTENSVAACYQHRKIAGDPILRIMTGLQNGDGALSVMLRRRYSPRHGGDIQVIFAEAGKLNVPALRREYLLMKTLIFFDRKSICRGNAWLKARPDMAK